MTRAAQLAALAAQPPFEPDMRIAWTGFDGSHCTATVMRLDDTFSDGLLRLELANVAVDGVPDKMQHGIYIVAGPDIRVALTMAEEIHRSI